METQNQADLASLAIPDFIQKRSEAGELVAAEDILDAFLKMGALTEKENQRADFEALLKKTVKQNEELKRIVDGKAVAYYYSTRTMTDAYAAILIRRGQDEALLMAETVRDNSRRYPRPVPVRMFEFSPYSLTTEGISSCLDNMADQEQYHDIQQTITSIGTVFLFSTAYLEPDYANFLAEWIDVGQARSP